MPAEHEIVPTRINGIDDGQGGNLAPAAPRPADPDLSVDSAQLAPIGEDARALARIATQGGHAAGATHTAVAALRAAGLGSGDALHHLMWQFTQRSLNLSRDCQRIAQHLTDTVADMTATEAEIEAQVRRAGNPISTTEAPLNYRLLALMGVDVDAPSPTAPAPDQGPSRPDQAL